MLTGSSTQSELGSNNKEGVLNISQIYTTGTSLSDAFMSCPGYWLEGKELPICRNTVGIYKRWVGLEQ